MESKADFIGNFAGFIIGSSGFLALWLLWDGTRSLVALGALAIWLSVDFGIKSGTVMVSCLFARKVETLGILRTPRLFGSRAVLPYGVQHLEVKITQ